MILKDDGINRKLIEFKEYLFRIGKSVVWHGRYDPNQEYSEKKDLETMKFAVEF